MNELFIVDQFQIVMDAARETAQLAVSAIEMIVGDDAVFEIPHHHYHLSLLCCQHPKT